MLKVKGNEKKERLIIKVKYSLYLATHPIDGFWDLKYANKGTLRAAFVIIFLFFLSVLFERQLTAWQFNEKNPESLNILTEFFTCIAPYAMWCISTWCVTSLLDGQGTIKDIVKATSYSLMPLLLANFIGVMISHVLVGREYVFYNIVSTIGMYWSLGLIFLSVVAIHQYTVSKAVFVTLLSLVGMVVMACLGILLLYLVQQLTSFGMELLKEYSLRIAE